MKKTQFSSILTFTLIMLSLLLLWCGCAFAEGESQAGTAPNSPSRPTGTVLPTLLNENTTREAFFANGTPITIREPKADTAGWVHDDEVQKGLQNGFSADKKPGTGALISWEEGNETRYVYVSGTSKVFGGSLNASVQGDISITVKGTNVRKAFPNVSFLFGGGFGGDVIGNITITMEESQMMYVYGGGYNGSVTGDVLIQSMGKNWSLDLVGGGLASSMTADAVADVGGNITLDLKNLMISYMDSLVAGGLAETISEHTARANVGGNITLYAEGRNVYQVCGGGEAFRTAEDCGEPTANVGGSVSVELRGSRVRYYAGGKTTILGGIFAGGLGYYGTAEVAGDITMTIGDTIFDDAALGIVLGGMAEGDTAMANVLGNARGQVESGCNISQVICGGVVHRGGRANVSGSVKWYYTMTDGMTDF